MEKTNRFDSIKKQINFGTFKIKFIYTSKITKGKERKKDRKKERRRKERKRERKKERKTEGKKERKKTKKKLKTEEENSPKMEVSVRDCNT